MINSTQIDLSQLVQVISQLVLKCSFIIKEISQNLNIVHYKDNKYDPVTQADYLVQQTISSYFAINYPNIQIIGEQNIQTDDQGCKKLLQRGQSLNSIKINQKELIHNYPYPKGKVMLEASKLCLWIDPLDCTRGFVSNKRQQVTILVGISYDHKPIAGIIGQPFRKSVGKNYSEFDPRIFVGSEYFHTIPNQIKYCFQYRMLKNEWRKWEQFHYEINSKIERKVAISSRRASQRQEQLMKSVKMQKMQIGGAGSKFIKVIKKQVASLMFVDATTSKWDSCAGEALIRAMGGYIIKPNLEQIIYNPSHRFDNKQGFIVSLSKNIFSQIREYISTQSFQNTTNQNALEPQLVSSN